MYIYIYIYIYWHSTVYIISCSSGMQSELRNPKISYLRYYEMLSRNSSCYIITCPLINKVFTSSLYGYTLNWQSLGGLVLGMNDATSPDSNATDFMIFLCVLYKSLQLTIIGK